MPEAQQIEQSPTCDRSLREEMPPPWTALPEEVFSCLESARMLYRVYQLRLAREAAGGRNRMGGESSSREGA